MRLVAYTRVSGQTQVTDGFGIDLQQEQITQWVTGNGHEIVHWSSDGGVSGMTEAVDRPGFIEAVNLIADGEADGFICYDLTRLARHLMIQEAALTVLWRAGAQVFTAATGLVADSDDPTVILVRQVLGAIAQFDKSQVVIRMQRGKAAAAAAGRKVNGRYAYGFHPDRPEEADTVRLIGKLHEEGRTDSAIADELERLGIPTRTPGKQWGRSTVRNILTRSAESETIRA